MEFNHAEVNRIRLHHARAGEGPLIVFVHGYPRHWYLWRHQLAEFSRDHLAVAIDMRGYNLSSQPERDIDYGVWQDVEDVRALVDQLGYERFVLVGHDWGGAVAWSFALHYPERLHAMVTMCAAHPALLDREFHANPELCERARGYMHVLRHPDTPATLEQTDFAALRTTLDFPFLDDQDRAAYLEAWRRPGAAASMLATDRREGMGPATEDGVPARGNYAPEVPSLRVEVPTLALTASDDPYNHPACWDGLETYVPDLRLERMEGSHWLPEERPDEVNRRIRSFLAARAATAA